MASSPIWKRNCAEGAAPLDIINGPLMAGMAEVGRLFNNNELIVAEVLQSAEAMKAARELSGAVHGEGRHGSARQDHPRDRQGRRPRHRQEPGRDHSEQQRLQGDQPGHQGSARGADPGLPRAHAGCHRPFRASGEEHAADGGHGGRICASTGIDVPLLVGGAALIGEIHTNARSPRRMAKRSATPKTPCPACSC